MEELFLLIEKTYGIAGLIMLSPFVGLVVVWKHNVSLQKDIRSISKENTVLSEKHAETIAKLQESRVADGKAMAEKILTLVEESAGTSKETAIALDQVRDLLMKLTTNSQRKY